MLIQNQAAFVSSLRETDLLHARFQRECAERFARIEVQMAEIIRVLGEYGRQLERLTDAVREEIGFKGQQWRSTLPGWLSSLKHKPPTPSVEGSEVDWSVGYTSPTSTFSAKPYGASNGPVLC